MPDDERKETLPVSKANHYGAIPKSIDNNSAHDLNEGIRYDCPEENHRSSQMHVVFIVCSTMIFMLGLFMVYISAYDHAMRRLNGNDHGQTKDFQPKLNMSPETHPFPRYVFF